MTTLRPHHANWRWLSPSERRRHVVKARPATPPARPWDIDLERTLAVDLDRLSADALKAELLDVQDTAVGLREALNTVLELPPAPPRRRGKKRKPQARA
jgi:hypothetical protein